MKPAAAIAALAVLAGPLAAAELSDRHELQIELDWVLLDTDSNLGAWSDGGFGKLRYDSNGSGSTTSRLAIDYQGQILPTLFSHVVMEVIEDAESHAGLTEAYLEWRPLPSSPNRHRLRFGAFYPAFSLENSGTAWSSPYTQSFSAVNSWIGEEIRPIGLDWHLTRPIGSARSPHELGVFAGVFYGNDPAGTLLVWRGWSVHDRQTRLNERIPLPPLVVMVPGGGEMVINRRLDPIAEIDDRPGLYAGSEWQYANRAKLSLGIYDNRADPYAFRDGQWAWGTRFVNLALQVSLPGDFGLIAQRMRGETDWLTPPPGDGILTSLTRLVTDEFDAGFLLLSKSINGDHRLSLRIDSFEIRRPGEIVIDHGHARTLAYRYAVNDRLDMRLEWLEIKSSRGLWPILYGQAEPSHTENLLQLGFRLTVFDSTN